MFASPFFHISISADWNDNDGEMRQHRFPLYLVACCSVSVKHFDLDKALWQRPLKTIHQQRQETGDFTEGQQHEKLFLLSEFLRNN